MSDEAHLRIWSAVLVDGAVRCEVADVGSEEMKEAVRGERPDRRGFIVHVLDMRDPDVHLNPVDDPDNFNGCGSDPCVPGAACSKHHAVARRWWSEWEVRFPQPTRQEGLFVAGSVPPEGRFSAYPTPDPTTSVPQTLAERVTDTIRHWRDQASEQCLCGDCEWDTDDDPKCPAVQAVNDVCDDFDTALNGEGTTESPRTKSYPLDQQEIP